MPVTIPSSAETWSMLAAARCEKGDWRNLVLFTELGIICAAASVDNVSPDAGIANDFKLLPNLASKSDLNSATTFTL